VASAFARGVVVAVVVAVPMVVTVVMAFMARIKDMDAPAVSLIIVLVMDMAVPVCPGLRLKACAHPMHMPAKPFDHGLQHMVGQQPQKSIAHLQRNMPIADVIRDARQRRRIVCMHFQQCFRRSLDRHHPTV
jgi:hypothetical protein